MAQVASSVVGVHPASSHRRPAAALSTGFSESVIAQAACPAARPAPPAARKPRPRPMPRPQLMTCQPRPGAALAAFVASRHRVERRCYRCMLPSSAHRGQCLISQYRPAGRRNCRRAPPRGSRRTVFIHEEYPRQNCRSTTLPQVTLAT